jgi:hypothetical protein
LPPPADPSIDTEHGIRVAETFARRALRLSTDEIERERRLGELATKLLFTLGKHGARFTLARDVDVPQPVCHENITLDEVE